MGKVRSCIQQNIIGSTLRKYRKGAKLSQREISARLELIPVYICRGSISRIENGERLVSDIELFALASVLGITPNDLMEWNQEKNIFHKDIDKI